MSGKTIITMTLALTVFWLSHYGVHCEVEWNPDWLPPRDDLICESDCDICLSDSPECKFSTHDKCCICSTKSRWEGNEQDLLIEYVSPLGKSLAFPTKAFSQLDFYKVEHVGGSMSHIPSNLCNWDSDPLANHITENGELESMSDFWDNIVLVNLANNRIRSLGNISCLSRLDRLYLQYNEIEHLSNTSLAGLSYLRFVDLSHNRITTMDAAVLFANGLNFFTFDMSHNQLVELDVTNMMGMKQFCEYNFDSNSISELTNLLNGTLTADGDYGPGFVSVSDNNFVTFPNFKEILNIDSLAALGSLIESGFDFLGPKLNCDCFVYDYVNTSRDILQSLFSDDYAELKCDTPFELKDEHVMEIAADKFICNKVPTCPNGSVCIEIPSKDTLYVNCSGIGISEFPAVMPKPVFARFIHLDVSRNHMKYLSSISYMNRINVLNVSYNDIEYVNETAVNLLPNMSFLDMSNNPNLRRLPRNMQYHQIQNVNMSSLLLICNCNSEWLAIWLPNRNTNHDIRMLFTCRLDDGRVIPGHEFTTSILQCDSDILSYTEHAIALAFISLALLTAAILSFYFRYEIIILVRKMQQQKSNTILPQFTYDAFVSLDEENDTVRRWVLHTMLPSLEYLGYRLFLPLRDISFGDIRDEAVISIMKDCRNFILVLSESYLQQDDLALINEWKYGWHMIMANNSKKVILVNFDHVSSSDVSIIQIKAYLRVGSTVDFLNQDGNIIDQIATRLGPPRKATSKGLENKRKKFVNSSIFQVDTANSVYDNICSNQNRRISPKNPYYKSVGKYAMPSDMIEMVALKGAESGLFGHSQGNGENILRPMTGNAIAVRKVRLSGEESSLV